MKSKFLDFIFGYEQSEKRFEESKIVKTEKRFADKVISGIGSAYSKRVLTSPAARFIANLRSTLARVSVKSYGILFLAFGLITMLANFAEYYFRDLPESPALELAVGISFSLLAVPLLFADKPLYELLERFPLTSFVLFDFLCLPRNREIIKEHEKQELAWLIPIFAATAFATFGYIFSLPLLLISVLVLVLIALAISSPEFSLMMTLMLLPLLPALPRTTLILVALVAITTVSFLIKVLLGKRLFHFEQYDAVMLMFMFFVLISGVFNKGIVSFENSLILISLGLIYFLVSNILVNRRLVENAVKIIVYSSIPCAIYGLITYYSTAVRPEWIDPTFSSISSRAYSTFGNPNVYSVFLIVAIVFSFALTLEKTERKYAPIYAAITALNVFLLVLTFTRGAWLAIIIAIIGFSVIRSRRCPKILLFPALLVPLALPFIPRDITERFLSIFNMQDSSALSRLSIWRSSLRMFTDNLFIGIGVGGDAFSEEFLKYAEDSVTAPHSHNLFIEIGCELGVFALILFMFMLLIRIRHRATYAKYVRNSSVDNLCTVAGTALFALLVFGMTDYTWFNPTMYVLFWTVFGIGSATLRISKKEYDDALIVSPQEAEDCSAAVSITIGARDKKERGV